MGKDYKQTSDKEEPRSQNTSVLEQAMVTGRGELSSQYQSSSINQQINVSKNMEKWSSHALLVG